MKIIDLLNKIANGEEVPKKIRIDHWCYKFEWVEHDSNYYDKHEDIDLMSCLSMDKEELNYEVHEIEEENKDNFTGWKMYQDGKEVCSMDCSTEEEKKIPEKLEDISEIKCVGCNIEINLKGNKMLFSTDTPIVTEHCIYKINQLIKNQKKIIDYLKSKGE